MAQLFLKNLFESIAAPPRINKVELIGSGTWVLANALAVIIKFTTTAPQSTK